MMNNDDDNDVDYDNHPDSMIVIVDDGVNAIGWESYNNVDNHDDDDDADPIFVIVDDDEESQWW